MATSIYKFENGRLLVHEQTLLRGNYVGSGVPHRIGHVRNVEKVLSVDTDYAKYGVLSPLSEVKVSNDNVFVVMRRADGGIGLTSGSAMGTSGAAAAGLVSGLLSGLADHGEILSGRPISGLITLTATVLGY